MKTKKSLGTFAIVLLLALVRSAIAGTEVGNPTDNAPVENGSAWYLGEGRTIHYCLDIAANFGVSKLEAQSAVDATFAIWAKYLRDRQILDSPDFKALGITLTTDLKIQESCDGKEDLKILFGSSSPAILKAREKYSNPTSIALRENYDMAKGWSKGLIWLAPRFSVDESKEFPDWTKDTTLKPILLHEFGHVLGVSHIAGTVMDEHLSDKISNGEDVLMQVDQRNQVANCWRCGPYRYLGTLGYSTLDHIDAASKVFKRFMGREPSGDVRVAFISQPVELSLLISDKKGSKQIPLDFDYALPGTAVHTGFDRGERIFKIVWKPANDVKVADLFNGGVILYGGIRDAKSKKLNLVLEVNSHSLASPGPYTLRWLEDGRAHALFFSGQQYE